MKGNDVVVDMSHDNPKTAVLTIALCAFSFAMGAIAALHILKRTEET